MSATYDANLPLERDHVRLLTGDTNVDDAQLSDQEIEAVIAGEAASGAARKWYAAATCLEVILARWSSTSRGVSSKSVSGLSISWGVPGSSLQTLKERVSTLRIRGASIASPAPSQFRVI